MAELRTWPALEVRARRADESGAIEGLVALALDDTALLAIEDVNPQPIPPGGLWDPTAPAPPDTPAQPLAWRVCFASNRDRDRAAKAIGALDLALDLRLVDLPDDDWVARSQNSLRAVSAGSFIVAPPWDVPTAVPNGAHLIVIEPSMGFGTGHHQTTRLCLAALGAVPMVGASVTDIGTGSGVLALAASLLGAGSVIGLDIDADAIEAARRSAALNTLPTPVRFETVDVFAAPPTPTDVVVANLTGAMLIRLAGVLAGIVAPAGHLVVSGFTHDERADVEAVLTDFDVVTRWREDEWCAAALRRR